MPARASANQEQGCAARRGSLHWPVFVGGLMSCLLLVACGSAQRAIVMQEDIAKVFPWPRDRQSVNIRVKPRTTLVNTCYLFGSYQEVTVTPQTTFYLVDELGKKFAYTPSRSPIRRLAPVESAEIRWPQATTKAKAEETGGEQAAPEKAPEKAPAGQPEPAPAPAKGAGGGGGQDPPGGG